MLYTVAAPLCDVYILYILKDLVCVWAAVQHVYFALKKIMPAKNTHTSFTLIDLSPTCVVITFGCEESHYPPRPRYVKQSKGVNLPGH